MSCKWVHDEGGGNKRKKQKIKDVETEVSAYISFI
jgi:hypothetical protein